MNRVGDISSEPPKRTQLFESGDIKGGNIQGGDLKGSAADVGGSGSNGGKNLGRSVPKSRPKKRDDVNTGPMGEKGYFSILFHIH